MAIQFGNLTNKVKIDSSQLNEIAKNSSTLKSASIFENNNNNEINNLSSQDLETIMNYYGGKNAAEGKEITPNADSIATYDTSEIDEAFSADKVSSLVLDALEEDIDEENGMVNINRQFDERVQQQGTGDCYLLATLKSLSESPQGQEIIKNTIQDNNDGTYTVKFPGIERSYTFNSDQIEAADSATIGSKDGTIAGSGMGRYSEGDDDIMLIELAYEQFREEAYHGQIQGKPEWPAYVLQSTSEANYNAGKSALTSGNMSQVMFLLTGEHAEYASGDKVHSELDKMNNTSDAFVAYASVYAENGYTSDPNGGYYKDSSGYYKKVDANTPAGVERFTFTGAGTNDRCITLGGVGGSEGQTIDLTTNTVGGHALTVTAVTDDTVTIINPWDSDKRVTVNRSELEGYITGVQYMKLS